MFEQTFVPGPARTRRAWTVAVSFCGQTALAALAALVPLVFYDSLPGVQLSYRAPAPPRPVNRPAQKAVKIVDVKYVPREGPITSPSFIPPKIAAINEIAAPPSLAPAGNWVGVPGGTGDPNASGFGSEIVNATAAIAPPPSAAAKAAEPGAAKRPEPPKRIRLSSILPANLVRRVVPEYPAIARQVRVEGTVRLQAVIGRDGTIRQLEFVSGPALLARAAMDAVRQWVYRPTMLNNEPVEVITIIEVNFVLHQ
jgi:protein TonB